MAFQTNQLHFLMFPFIAQGHMIPMIDIARLLAMRGVVTTIVTTPHNAARFATVLARATNSGLQIRVIELELSCEEAGIPRGTENIDMLSSMNLGQNLFTATCQLQKPMEKLVKELTPKPNCVISDMCLPWTINIAHMLKVPRISFNGLGCFCQLCLYNVYSSNILENLKSDSEFFVVPNLPDRIEITKSQFPGNMNSITKDFREQMKEAEEESYGFIINTFEELETKFIEQYKKVREDKVWCIGPVSLCNKDDMDKAQRGNKSVVSKTRLLNWLDKWEENSVVYACLGSLCNFVTSQWIELGLGLEASKKPFIWVIRGGSKLEEVENWIKENGFEERIKERGLLIRGWAPQVLILSHPSIGGFLTHCGWNSTLEGISFGVPLITWPLFGDQFLNEKLVFQVLKIAVRVGVVDSLTWGEEEKIGVLVGRENVRMAIEEFMDEGKESKEMRERVKKLAQMAKRAVEEGGSSYANIDLLIQEIKHLANGEDTKTSYIEKPR